MSVGPFGLEAGTVTFDLAPHAEVGAGEEVELIGCVERRLPRLPRPGLAAVLGWGGATALDNSGVGTRVSMRRRI